MRTSVSESLADCVAIKFKEVLRSASSSSTLCNRKEKGEKKVRQKQGREEKKESRDKDREPRGSHVYEFKVRLCISATYLF